jgi:hypothetical protein
MLVTWNADDMGQLLLYVCNERNEHKIIYSVMLLNKRK